MSRLAYKPKRVDFHQGALGVGRKVKSCPYSPELAQRVRTTGIAERDIEGWCNLHFTIMSVSQSKGTVLLRYAIPKTINQVVYITWPIDCLCKKYGVKI